MRKAGYGEKQDRWKEEGQEGVEGARSEQEAARHKGRSFEKEGRVTETWAPGREEEAAGIRRGRAGNVVIETRRFQDVAKKRTRDAAAANVERLSTVFDRSDCSGLQGIGNTWTRLHYGGEFGLLRPRESQTAASLVFIQTKDGNTGGPDPSAFGGGATDTHLIYEGLSRVAADGVLAGSGSVHRDAFFSVWHPELIALRASFALPRHPAQIVVSKRGRLDVDALLFTVPEVPVVLIAGDECIARHRSTLLARPWIRVLFLDGDNLDVTFNRLRLEHGIERISAIGGRFTATQLVDAGLIQDIYLTTTALQGGEPGTPWYSGAAPPQLTAMARKEWSENGSRVAFEHCMIGPAR